MGGMMAGTNPFAGMSAADQQTLASSPSFQSGQFQGPAQAQLGRQIADAVRALRNGAGSSTPAVQTALQAAALLGAYGALTPELEGAAGRVSALAQRAGQGALVPYVSPGVPAPYISPRAYVPPPPIPSAITLPDMSPSTMARITSANLGNDPILKMLTKMEEDEKTLIGIERHRLNLQQASIRPSFMPPGAGTPNPAFMPPGAISPSQFNAGSTIYKSPIGPPVPPPTGPTVMTAFGPVNANSLTAAGGGFGGGGGGGRGNTGAGGAAGGGGGGSFNVPGTPTSLPHLMRTIGSAFGSAAGAVIGGGGGAVIGRMIGDTMGSILAFPQEYQAFAGSALSASDPYFKLVTGTAAIGRASTDVSYGGNLLNSLFPGRYQQSPLLSSLGLTPNEGLSLLQNFGILPGRDDPEGLISVLGGSKFLPGLSGLPEGMANQSAALAARLGAIQPTGEGVGAYQSQLGNLFETAIARGMDRASILRSINAAVSVAARNGAVGVSPINMGEFLMRFSGLPGGNTGETGARIAGGIDALASQFGSNPMRTMTVATFASQFTSTAKVQHYLDKTAPGLFSQIMGDPGSREVLNDMVTAAKAGDTVTAGAYFLQLTAGNTAAQIPAYAPGYLINSQPGYRRPLIGGGLTGMNGPEFVHSQMHGSVSVEGSTFDQSKTGVYYAALRRMGMSNELAVATIVAARKHGIDPIAFGAVANSETNFGKFDPRNPFQAKGSSGLVRSGADVTGPMMSADLGAEVFAYAQAKAHGDTMKTLQYYTGGPVSAQYFSSYESALGAASLPSGTLAGRAAAGQAITEGQSVSFAQMNVIIPAVNAGLAKLIDAAQTVARAFTEMGNLSGMGGSYATGGSPQ